MSQTFDKIIDEQVRLLSDKGYNGNGLNSFNSEADIRGRLVDNLSWAVLNPNKHTPPEFRLTLMGFFAGDSDVVGYQFSYRYLAQERKLQMTNTHTTLMGVSLEKAISDPEKELARAEAVYQQLKSKMALTWDGDAFNPTRAMEFFDPYTREKIMQISSDNTIWLIQNGYIASSIALKKGEDQFTNALRDQLTKFHHFGYDTTRTFVLNSGRVFDDDFEKMNFRIFYKYDMGPNGLGFRAVRAGLGQQHKTTLLHRSLRPPPAEHLYQELFHLRRTATARRIIDHQFTQSSRGLK